MDEQVVTKYGRRLSEKMLRLFDESVGQEKFCSLREEWEASEVEPGDIVHITGWNSSSELIKIHYLNNCLIHGLC